MQLRHLEEAERHVAQGQRHIAEQGERIEHFARLGANTAEARTLLKLFYATQVQHLRHRDRILRELEQ